MGGENTSVTGEMPPVACPVDDKSKTDEGDKVRVCYCREAPDDLPIHFTPCCLPVGTCLSTREIQMFPEFRDNLLGTRGAPPKTQTIRVWGQARMAAHHQSFTSGKWIRVWRGQGHKDTIGWLLIKRWDVVKVRNISKSDCVREGRPNWSPTKFKSVYLGGLTPNTNVTRIQFDFHRCKKCV